MRAEHLGVENSQQQQQRQQQLHQYQQQHDGIVRAYLVVQ